MARFFALLTLLALVSLAIAQESNEDPAAAEDTGVQEAGTDESEEDAAEIDPELLDDIELDEQTYEEDEDVFIPTEEIPSDEPIPFPTNI